MLFGSLGVQLSFWGHGSPLSCLFALTPRGGAAERGEFGELCLGSCVKGARLTLLYCLDAVLSLGLAHLLWSVQSVLWSLSCRC